MSRLSNSLYIPLSSGASIGGGPLVGNVFTGLWKRTDGSDPPDPQDLEQPMTSARFAAALPGVLWGVA